MRGGSRFWVAALIALGAAGASSAACGHHAGGTGGQTTTSSGAGGDQATPDEADAANAGGDSSSSLGQLLSVADAIFSFDPTIDPTKSAAQNAAAIQANATAALAGCGTVTLNGTTITVSFGSPPGCKLESGVAVSGTVIVGVSTAGSTVTLSLTLQNLVAGGKSIAGTASFATTNGTTFALTANLTSGTATDTVSLTVTGSTSAFTIDGTSTAIQGTSTTSYTFKGVVWQPGQCYPQAGSIQVVKGKTSITLTFSSSTPATGQITVTAGKRSYPQKLPAYGTCPGDGGA